MWREFIQSLQPLASYPLEVQYTSGASSEQLQLLDSELKIALPGDLKALLQESNGVSDQFGLHLIWSTEEITQYNREMRTSPIYRKSYMSFADMLFFADAGNGDRFAFPILQGKVKAKRVFAWNHEDDSRMAVAFSLKSYLERLIGGKIKR